MRQKYIVLTLVILLAGCSEQKSQEEQIRDIKNLDNMFSKCIQANSFERGDLFCEYTLEDKEFMREIILLAKKRQIDFGKKILFIQQEIDRLSKLSDDDSKKSLADYQRKLQKCYLIHKMISSIKA